MLEERQFERIARKPTLENANEGKKGVWVGINSKLASIRREARGAKVEMLAWNTTVLVRLGGTHLVA